MERLSTAAVKEIHAVATTNGQANFTSRPAPQIATDKQVAFIHRLLEDKQVPNRDSSQAATWADDVRQGYQVGRKEASKTIDWLLSLPPKETREPSQPKLLTNRYAGRCRHCGYRVEAEEGIALKDTEAGRWVVEHLEDECPTNQFPFPLGRYAVETDEGHLAFYQATEHGLFVQASDDLHQIAGTAQQAIIDKIAVDPEEATARYGREIGACGICGRTLTNPESREYGIGPHCREKFA